MMVCPRCWGGKHEPINSDVCFRCKGVGVMPDVQLSKNFWLSEFLYSETAVRSAIPNEPSPHHVENLTALCKELIQPMRNALGPVSISSGLRLHALNAAVGGSDSSAHQNGWAADASPLGPGVSRKKMVDWLIASKLGFDQVIFEGTWVHIAHFGHSSKQRRQALMAFPTYDPKRRMKVMQFSPYDPNDPRMRTA